MRLSSTAGLAQFQVKSTERLVEQAAPPVDERPVRHAAAGPRSAQLVLGPVPQLDGSSISATRCDLGRGDFLAFQSEGHVLRDGHVREQGVALKTMLTSRRFGGTPVTSLPDRRTTLKGSSKPAIIRMVVVLPQPEGPSREKNSLTISVDD